MRGAKLMLLQIDFAPSLPQNSKKGYEVIMRVLLVEDQKRWQVLLSVA
jgi:hypothetical protein